MDLHKNNKPKKPCALSCHSRHPLSTPCTMLVNTPKMGDNDTEAFARPHHPNMARNVKYACEVNQDRSVICCWLTCFSKNWKQNAPSDPPKTKKTNECNSVHRSGSGREGRRRKRRGPTTIFSTNTSCNYVFRYHGDTTPRTTSIRRGRKW